VSDVYATTCGVTLTSDFKEYDGPVQAMTFSVHPQSTETSISAEAARVVLKYVAGCQFKVAPWTNKDRVLIRPRQPPVSGARGMVCVARGLAHGAWNGTIMQKSGDVLGAVSSPTTADNATIGILSTTLTDKNRVGNAASTTQVKVLAFQAKDQLCGYYPDS